MPVNSCCCAKCGGCSNPPTTIAVVISGVTICSPGCTSNAGFEANSFSIASITNVNGSYCLTHDTTAQARTPANCVYTATISPPVVVNYYGSSQTCTGVPVTYNIDTVAVIFEPTNTILIECCNYASVNTTGVQLAIAFSSGLIIQTPNCKDGTFSNALSCVSVSGVSDVGHGGTATITMNGC